METRPPGPTWSSLGDSFSISELYWSLITLAVVVVDVVDGIILAL